MPRKNFQDVPEGVKQDEQTVDGQGEVQPEQVDTRRRRFSKVNIMAYL
jgi:hypothetical protein